MKWRRRFRGWITAEQVCWHQTKRIGVTVPRDAKFNPFAPYSPDVSMYGSLLVGMINSKDKKIFSRCYHGQKARSSFVRISHEEVCYCGTVSFNLRLSNFE